MILWYYLVCLFVLNVYETAIHTVILGTHCCSTPWDFITHTLLRTACGKDVFCENCREYALIENKLFVGSQTGWWLLCCCRWLLPSLALLLSSEMQDLIDNSGRAEGKEIPEIKLAFRTGDTCETFSTAREKHLIALDMIKSGPKIIYFLTKACQRLSHLVSQMIHGNYLLLCWGNSI